MDPESWREVRALFDELVELHGDQQAERLAAIGATDPGLRDSVAALLTADSQADEQLGEVEAALLPPPPTSPISALPQDPFGLSGRTVAHFRVIEPLGLGGMGVVYRAEDLRLSRTVALKVPLPGYRLDASAKQRFLHEARSAAALDHPNLCSIYEVGESEEGHPFLAMPLYPGETLKERLAREGQLPLEEAVEIARQLAEGLAAAHGAGIVHRDIKPGNVMLLPNGKVKILDFGLAKVRDLTLTGSRAQLGTVAYMAPEQIRRESINERTDLWALGVVLYEMLTGRRPFEGEHEVSIAHAIVHEEPLRPSALRGEIPRALEGFLCTLLCKEPASRPASAQQVAAELAAIQAGRALALRRALGQRWAAATGWRGRRGRGRATGVLLVAGLVGVALLGALVASGVGTPLIMFRAGIEAPAPAVPASARTAVAALPFANLSAEGEHAYVAAALHTELLTQLSQVAALTLISRTSVMAYEGTGTPLKQLASELGVGSVLEGSVQVLNGRLRVNVQLIDAATDAHLWANRYDRPLEDAFAIQSDIAQQIATAVGAALSGAERLGLAEAPTANTEAYHLYLQGRDYLNRPGLFRRDAEIAQQLFEQALILDPSFALARAALSQAHGRMYWRRYDPTPARAARQWDEAEAALRLAPHLPQAHAAMGLAHYWGRRDYQRALESFATALEGLPNDAWLWTMVAAVHRRLGNWSEVAAAFEKAIELDPRSADLVFDGGMTADVWRRYPDAVRAHDRAMQLAPDLYGVAVWKGWTYVRWMGQFDTLRAALSRLPADAHLGGLGTQTTQHVQLLLWDRQPDSLLHVLATTRPGAFQWLEGSVILPELWAAWAHRMRGDPRAAHTAFETARDIADSVMREHPNEWRVHAMRGLAMAGLGHREEARREARWLQGSEIYRNDVYFGAQLAEYRARILAQVGDAEAALDEIEGLLARPSLVSVHTLRLDPLLDPLRGHPRFQALLAGSAGQ